MLIEVNLVNLLVQFFGSMFSIDHKAGIMPAAKALLRISAMSAFSPENALAIIEHVCKIGGDFKNQVPKTRLAVYDLFGRLFETEAIRSELQYKYGASCGFIVQILQLCRNERDPMCLLKYFPILRRFISDFDQSGGVTEEIFSGFSAYFPISLRASTHPSGVTAVELKAALRACFAVDDIVSKLAIPFLIQRLDQGDAVSVSVKVSYSTILFSPSIPQFGLIFSKADILETLISCLKSYKNPTQSINPHVDLIWNSLKYEIRNGEVEESVEKAGQTIHTMASRLEGEVVRKFSLTVLRHCVDDLENPTYTHSACQLLDYTASASPTTWEIIMNPALAHVKDNLKRTKSTNHTKDLLSFVNRVLERRRALSRELGPTMTTATAGYLTSSDAAISLLYDDTYLSTFQSIRREEKKTDEMDIYSKVAEGMSLLACQMKIDPSGSGNEFLLNEESRSKIFADLLNIILSSESLHAAYSKLVVNMIGFASDIVVVNPLSFKIAVEKWFKLSNVNQNFESHAEDLNSAISSDAEIASRQISEFGSRLAMIACKKLPVLGDPAANFVSLAAVLLESFRVELSSPEPYCGKLISYIKIIAVAIHVLDMAFEDKRAVDDKLFSGFNWVEYVHQYYPELPDISADYQVDATSAKAQPESSTGYSRFLLTSLFVLRQLYRRATTLVKSGSTIVLEQSLDISKLKGSANIFYELSLLASCVISKIPPDQQKSLNIFEEVVYLFRGDDSLNLGTIKQGYELHLAADPAATTRVLESSAALTTDRVSQFPLRNNLLDDLTFLSLGILKPLHPSSVQSLVSSNSLSKLKQKKKKSLIHRIVRIGYWRVNTGYLF
jgi:DNA repair/transcription protein MET18/MMS19